MHQKIMNSSIFDTLVNIFLSSLDPKCVSDHETSHFCLLLVANLLSCDGNRATIIDKTLGKFDYFSS